MPAELDAYKLTVMLGSTDAALTYLGDYEKENNKVEHVLHDACLFDLPENDNWDVTSWNKIYSKFMRDGQFRKSFATSKPSDIQEILLHDNKYSIHENLELSDKQKQLKDVHGRISNINKKIGAIHKKEIEGDIESLRKSKNTENGKERQLKADIQKLKKSGGILLSSVPLAEILNIAKSIRYKRSDENKFAATEFERFGVPELVFNEMLEILPQATNSDDHIPPVVVKGKDIVDENWFMIKMSLDDPRQAILGYIVGDCQSLGSQGASCAKHGITSENGGFYLMCKGEPPADGDTKKIKSKDILSQCWAWLGHGEVLVFDSIETKKSTSQLPGNELKIVGMYTALAKKIIEQSNLKAVNVGTGGETSNMVGYSGIPHAGHPEWTNAAQASYRNENYTTQDGLATIVRSLDNVAYNDSVVQRVLFDRSKPIYGDLFLNVAEQLKSYISLTSEEKERISLNEFANILFKIGSPNQLDEFLNSLSVDERKDAESIMTHQAAMNNNVELLKHFSSKGYDMYCKNENAQTPLFLAARYGHKESFEFLSDMMPENFDLLEVHMGACLSDKMDVLKILYEKHQFDINNDLQGVMWSGIWTDKENLSYLISKGFKTDVVTEYNSRTLLEVIIEGMSSPPEGKEQQDIINIAKLLIDNENSVDIRHTDEFGKSAIDYAKEKGAEQVEKFLTKRLETEIKNKVRLR